MLQDEAAVAKMEEGAVMKPQRKGSAGFMRSLAAMCGGQSLSLEDGDDPAPIRPAKQCVAHLMPMQNCLRCRRSRCGQCPLRSF